MLAGCGVGLRALYLQQAQVQAQAMALQNPMTGHFAASCGRRRRRHIAAHIATATASATSTHTHTNTHSHAPTQPQPQAHSRARHPPTHLSLRVRDADVLPGEARRDGEPRRDDGDANGLATAVAVGVRVAAAVPVAATGSKLPLLTRVMDLAGDVREARPLGDAALVALVRVGDPRPPPPPPPPPPPAPAPLFFPRRAGLLRLPVERRPGDAVVCGLAPVPLAACFGDWRLAAGVPLPPRLDCPRPGDCVVRPAGCAAPLVLARDCICGHMAGP